MTIAYLDCVAGISGDMTLGALLDCGVPLDALRAGLSSLPVEGWQIDAEPILQSGIHALNVSISLDGQTDAQELEAVHHADHHHEHSHDHDHHHEHAHEHTHEHHHEHVHVHGRSMAEIRQIIEASELSARVKRDALAIFGRIAEAEAYLHHSTPDEIHFHEIGGVDSLLDICGAAWCLEYLGVHEVQCSPLPYSTGFVNCAHGRMPVPAPATLELLKGVPTIPAGNQGEMVTPTGAGIVAALATRFGLPPSFAPSRIGMGAGKKTFADRPNLLRVILGETQTSNDGLEWRDLTSLECNIDDMNPEFYPVVLERLLEAGALDAWLEPIQMKKGRPAHKLCALCDDANQNEVLKAILRETTTLGVRIGTTKRAALAREIETVATPFGAVRVKIAHWQQENLRRAVPEWEDVALRAREHSVPLRDVYQAALQAGEAMQSTSQQM